MKPSQQITAYCTASEYTLGKLVNFLKEEGLQPVLYRDLAHLATASGDLFFFSYGVVIFWGLVDHEELEWLEKIRPFEIGHLKTIEHDEFTFSWGPSFRIHQDEIILPTEQIEAKIAVSYGLAQSVKLFGFENRIQTTIAKTRVLPETLAIKGKIPLSRREISQTVGELFIERNSVNLHTDILDTPEFFWDTPELEPFYRSMVQYLDVRPRVEVLNKRLDIVKELLEILSNQLDHQHSSRLEWIIIFLILFEVAMTVVQHFG